MAPVNFRELTQDDLKDQKLTELNDLLQQVINQVNTLSGFTGTIPFLANVDMQGHRIINLGSEQADTDALSKTAADALYGVSVVQKQIEATGTKMQQTFRRLDDKGQQEQYSTFLKATVSTPPGSNNSTASVVNNGDGTSTATVGAGLYTYGDNSVDAYQQAQLTVANPVATTYYFCFFNFSTKALQFDGPYATNNSINQMNSNIDGRGYVALVQFAAAGGGTAGGGIDPVSSGGCTLLGTPLYMPADSESTVEIQPERNWVEIEFVTAEKIVVARHTLVACFIPAEDLPPGVRVETTDGNYIVVQKAEEQQFEGQKQKVRVKPQGTYHAGTMKVRLHNVKPRL